MIEPAASEQATSQQEAVSTHPFAEQISTPERGFWTDFRRDLIGDKAAMLGGVIVVVLLLIAILAPALAPYDPEFQLREGLTDRGEPISPSLQFLAGTDNLGRDVASRLIEGGRVSLGISFLGNFLAAFLGLMIGGVAGFFGGWTDTIIMRLIDIFLSFPLFLLAVVLLAVSQPSPTTITLIIGFVFSIYLSRIVYGQVVSIKEKDYILAARMIGVPTWRILLRHIFPQLISVVVVYLTLSIASAIKLEAALSYVGIGVQPPTPSWGNMISDGQYYYRAAPWLVLFPGLAIMLTVLGFNLLGDGIRDALDPTMQNFTRGE